MRAVVLTSGDPRAVTGGSLYHRRMAERAGAHGVDVDIRPLAPGRGAGAMADGADVVVVDSIVAARVEPSDVGGILVASVHQRPGGLTGSTLGRMARAAADVRLYRRAAAVVVPSAHLRDVLARAGVRRERVHVVEPGSDVPGVRPRPSRADGPVAFVSVGNLSPHKRPLDLLDAFARLGDLHATLTLAGGAADAALASAVETRLGAPDLAERAVWVGSVPPDGVGALLDGSDVAVSPALHESYGIAVAEALRAGLPAIVAGSGNLPELVADGVEGFVVPPRDAGALAAAMRRLASDAVLRDAMAAAARVRAGRLPTWDAAAERFASVLRSVQPDARRSAA